MLHLMIAGRLQWRAEWPAKLTKAAALALGFESGTLLLTEAGTKKRASLHVVRGRAGLGAHERGGIELDGVSAAEFEAALQAPQSHVEARADRSALDQRHRQRLLGRDPAPRAPVADHADEPSDVRGIARVCLRRHARCSANGSRGSREKAGGEFPSKVTAFHDEMAVHGKFGKPCPVCETQGAAHPLRRQRDQLLSALPDERPLARRPLVVAAAEERLAAIDRRAGANAAVSTEWPRIIVHADMDAFYAAVEQLDDPRLRGRPLLVGSDSARGVVLTASYEARSSGAGSAMPMQRARRLCPEALVVPPRFERYQQISELVMDAFAQLLAARGAPESRRSVPRHDGRHAALR